MNSIILPQQKKFNRRIEPLWISLLKLIIFAIAISLYLWPYSSYLGIFSAIGLSALAIVIADSAYRHRMRFAIVIAIASIFLTGAIYFGQFFLNSKTLVKAIGLYQSFVFADVLFFGLALFGLMLFMRFASNRYRAFSLLEVLFVALSISTILADHRNRMINRPRFFSDWAWSLGIDPTTVLIGIGIVASLAAILLFLRDQPLLKVLTSLLLLIGLGLIFYYLGNKTIELKTENDSLGLRGKAKNKNDKNKKGKGKGKGGGTGGKGNKNNPFRNNYDSPPPQPVAIAILRDDHRPQGGIMYFRQRVLSKYNGVHLTADENYDNDVVTDFGDSGESLSENTQNIDNHSVVPTTMYLLVDHPQPPALTHAIRLKLIQNPNPQQFVSAYEVQSSVLSVPPKRLLGRHSISSKWTKQKRLHYTKTPDDPRYRTLADIITRKLDTRYADDDLAKAFAVKRYLEKEGFYTRQSKHASQKDPAASFLFGDMRGYCVHFAHSAVYLFRSLGIAARVALGYAVQTNKRAGGSSILVMGDRAHAWPEIYLEGIGWVTFDIYPERTDLPPPSAVDYDLEKLLGELARKDPTGGLSPDESQWTMPWLLITEVLALFVVLFIFFGYFVKITRRLLPIFLPQSRYCRSKYLLILDKLSEVGLWRRKGETREAHIIRLHSTLPSFKALTYAHLARAFGSTANISPQHFSNLSKEVENELKTNLKRSKRLRGLLNPYSWIHTR